MTKRDLPERPDRPEHLVRLYQEYGDVEPAAGLDRRVRARAEQAVVDSTVRRPARWMGGVAAAAVAVLAIGVVLHQVPPTPDHAPVLREPAAPEAEDVGEMEAPSSLLQAPERQRAPRPSAYDESASGRTAAESDDALRREPEMFIPLESRSLGAQAPAEPAPAATLVHIQTLIEDGDFDQAREMLRVFRELYPDTEIPDSILDVLDEGAGQ